MMEIRPLDQGYVDPSEAADEMFEEALESFLEELSYSFMDFQPIRLAN